MAVMQSLSYHIHGKHQIPKTHQHQIKTHQIQNSRFQKEAIQLSFRITLTVIFPALYSFSASGSRAGRRENSKPSTSFQSSAWPSIVTSPGLNSATSWDSESESQCHSPDSSCELTCPINARPRTERRNNNGRTRCIMCVEEEEILSNGCFFIPVFNAYTRNDKTFF